MHRPSASSGRPTSVAECGVCARLVATASDASPRGEPSQASNGRASTPIDAPAPRARRRVRARDGPRASNGWRSPTVESSASGSLVGRRRSCQHRSRLASSNVVPRERHRRGRDQPAEENEDRQRLASRIDERRLVGALDDAKLDAVLHGDLGRELPRMDHVEESASWPPNVSLVAFGADRPSPVIVIIGVAAPTVDSTAAAAIGSAPFFRSSVVEQAAPLELSDDRVTGGESRVDVDQTREPTRVGERRAEPSGAGGKHRPQLRRSLLRQHERRLVRPDLGRAIGDPRRGDPNVRQHDQGQPSTRPRRTRSCGGAEEHPHTVRCRSRFPQPRQPRQLRLPHCGSRTADRSRLLDARKGVSEATQRRNLIATMCGTSRRGDSERRAETSHGAATARRTLAESQVRFPCRSVSVRPLRLGRTLRG